MLHYGLFNEAGALHVRLTWDHRVMDGAVAARILVALERTLQGDILAELTRMRWVGAA
jgi:pyruvate/2-oxoglutarate dehydrogenase complex dihydrolipoamide acyltransferase (E2) component